MPQLPSGRHVALSGDYTLALARKGDLRLSLGFTMHVQSADDLAPLLNVIYFKPAEGKPGPGEPYPSGLMLSDVGTEKCDWSDEDTAFFSEWLASDAVQQWLRKTYDDLEGLIRTVKAPLPANLHGILDGDD